MNEQTNKTRQKQSKHIKHIINLWLTIETILRYKSYTVVLEMATLDDFSKKTKANL